MAGDLGLELDVSDLESDLGSEDEGEGVGGLGLDRGLVGWSYDRGARRVARRADFGVARNLFGVSAGGSRSDRIGVVGSVGAMPAAGFGGAVQVEPALPLPSRRASPGGGEGQAAGTAVEDVDMGGTGSGGVVPTPVGVDSGCGCNCGVALAGVRQELAREVSKARDEMMGAISLLLAERGLGTWEEDRRLENTNGQLVRDRERARKSHEAAVVAKKVKADEDRRLTEAREAETRVEEAALRQESERVARL